MGDSETREEVARRQFLDRAWLTFVSDGVESEGLSEPIIRSWRRCRDTFGIDPALRRCQRLLAADELAFRRERDDAMRNIVTRALGSRADVQVDVSVEALLPGDEYLLCSDGLNTMLTDDEIGIVLETHAADPKAACGALIDAANRRRRRGQHHGDRDRRFLSASWRTDPPWKSVNRLFPGLSG